MQLRTKDPLRKITHSSLLLHHLLRSPVSNAFHLSVPILAPPLLLPTYLRSRRKRSSRILVLSKTVDKVAVLRNDFHKVPARCGGGETLRSYSSRQRSGEGGEGGRREEERPSVRQADGRYCIYRLSPQCRPISFTEEILARISPWRRATTRP